MKKSDWRSETTTLRDLTHSARLNRLMPGAVPWLKKMGLVPKNVTSGLRVFVRVGLDPNAIPVGYLADSAFEWDTWGPSSPLDFVRALECEMAGGKRDVIADVLASLGSARVEEAVDAVA